MREYFIQDCFGNDIEIDFDYDIIPGDPCGGIENDEFDIYDVHVVETGAEISLLPEGFESLESDIRDRLEEDSTYNKYGYLLDS